MCVHNELDLHLLGINNLFIVIEVLVATKFSLFIECITKDQIGTLSLTIMHH